MTTLVINAAGKGTRLGQVTELAPKSLAPLGRSNILLEQLKAFKSLFNNNLYNIVLITDYKEEILINYVNKFLPEYNWIICNPRISLVKDIETAYQLHVKGDSFLIWSDIIPADLVKPDKDTVFVHQSKVSNGGLYTPNCRCQVMKSSKRVIVSNTPEKNNRFEYTNRYKGIPGLFYFKNPKVVLEKFKTMHDSMTPEEYTESEFVDVLKLWKPEELNLVPLTYMDASYSMSYNVIKSDYENNVVNSRVESVIEFKNNTIIKHSESVPIEVEWYKAANKFIKSHVPKVLDESRTTITLEKIPGISLYEISTREDQRSKFIFAVSEAMEALKKLHEVKITAHKRDYLDMYVNKVYSRFVNTESLRLPVRYVNEQKISNYGTNLAELFEVASHNIDLNKFSMIHGDPNFSNIFYDSKVYFLDPRGKFGSTKVYGDKYYDYAKILYGFSGYDAYNMNRFKFKYEESIQTGLIEIQTNFNYLDGINLFENVFDFSPEEIRYIEFIVATIWLSVGMLQYFSYSSMQVGYFMGLLYLNKWIENYYG